MSCFAYDEASEPPAPVLPLAVAAPNSERAVLLPAIVDTGADCTVIPELIADKLGLPTVDRVTVSGVSGKVRKVSVHAADVELARLKILARVVALGREAIIGRDLLNRMVLELDGPKLRLAVRSSRARSRRTKKSR